MSNIGGVFEPTFAELSVVAVMGAPPPRLWDSLRDSVKSQSCHNKTRQKGGPCGVGKMG